MPAAAQLTVHGAASEKCQQEKRKTVNGEDILFAMTSLGFENYAEALKVYLSKYREVGSPLSTSAAAPVADLAAASPFADWQSSNRTSLTASVSWKTRGEAP